MESDFRLSKSGSAGEQVRWCSWPCSQCAAGATPVGLLGASHRANPQVSHHASSLSVNERIEYLVGFERGQLALWCSSCAHVGGFREDTLLRIAEGSEHTVYKCFGEDEGSVDVVKITHFGLYGDYYEVEGGRISQFACTPSQYLTRMGLLDNFGLPTTPAGITEFGQIVSRQKFIVGDLPSQAEVNAFMIEAGMIPVKVECFLWKTHADDIEIWVGDVRDENFVKTDAGIVPIDIRMWTKRSIETTGD